MHCLSPINIPNPGWQTSSDTGYGIFKRLLVPCGKCAACLANKANEWALRLEHELSVSTKSYFITLTYDDAHLPRDENDNPCFDKPQIQRWLKRLRKQTDNKLKYFLVSEYGSQTHRPHYHLILFNYDDDIYNALNKTWPYGQFHVGDVTSKSIRYTTKYSLKGSEVARGQEPCWRLMSKKLGSSYIEKKSKWHLADKTRFYSTMRSGTKIAMPRYYKQKIYSRYDQSIHANESQRLAQERQERQKRTFMDASSQDDSKASTLYYRAVQEEKEVIQRCYEKKSKLEKL